MIEGRRSADINRRTPASDGMELESEPAFVACTFDLAESRAPGGVRNSLFLGRVTGHQPSRIHKL